MVENNPSAEEADIGLAVALFVLIIGTIAFIPFAFPADEVTVADQGPNSVVIDNAGDSPVTATVDSDFFTFNATVDAGETTIVPTDDADDVTIHSEAGR